MNSDRIKSEAEELLLSTADEVVEAICLNTLAIAELNTTMVFFKEAYRNNRKKGFRWRSPYTNAGCAARPSNVMNRACTPGAHAAATSGRMDSMKA